MNSPTESEGTSAPKPTWLAVLLIASVALLTHGWMTSLEFQLDDWVQIRDAVDSTRPATLLGGDPNATQYVSFFRPLLYLSFELDVLLVHTSPFGLHLISVLYHVLTSLVLFFVLRRAQVYFQAGHESLPLIAAIIFAGHPSSWGAVSWVTARGDLLACLLTILAFNSLLSWRRHASLSQFILVCALSICAILSKEGAVVVPVILLLADYFFVRRSSTLPQDNRGARYGHWLVLLAIPIAYTLIRRMIFGQATSLYGGAVRVINFEVVKLALTDFFRELPSAFGGYFNYQSGNLTVWIQIAVLIIFTLGLIDWIRTKADRRLGVAAFLFFCFAFSMGPAMAVYTNASVLVPSRLYYFSFPILSLLMAIPMIHLLTRGDKGRLAGLGLVIVASMSWVAGGLSEYADQTHAAEVTRQVKADIRTLAKSASAPDASFIVRALPHKIDKVPLFGIYMKDAFHKSFTDQPASVFQSWQEDLKTDLRSGSLFQNKRSIQFLRWVEADNEAGGKLIAETPVLPGSIGYRPKIAWPAHATTVELDKPVHPRDVTSFAVRFRKAPDESFTSEIKFYDDRGSYTAKLDWKPQVFGTAPVAHFVLSEDTDWLFRGAITKIEFKTTYGKTPPVREIDFGAKPPEIKILNTDKDVVSLSGPELKFRFEEENPCPWYRLRIFFVPVERRWTLPLNVLETKGKEIVMTMAKGGFHHDEEAISWEMFRAGALQAMDGSASRELELNYTIEGLRGNVAPDAPAQSKSRFASMIIRR